MGKAELWIHGHIHESVDYEVNGTRLVSNPRGYKHKNNGGMQNQAFQGDFKIDV